MKVELPNMLRQVPGFRKLIGNGEIEDTPRRTNGTLKPDRGTVIEINPSINPSQGQNQEDEP
jgi:hypothetical protein